MTAMFVLPTVVMGAAVLALVPDSFDRTIWAVLIAHVIFNLAVVVRVVGATWERLPRDMEHAAATLGASPLAVFRHVTLPLLRPALLAAGSIVFVFTFTSYGVIRVLAAPGTRTIEVEVWRNATQLGRVGHGGRARGDPAGRARPPPSRGRAAASVATARAGRHRRHAVATRSRHARRSDGSSQSSSARPPSVTIAPARRALVRSLSTPTGWSTAAWTRLGRVEVRPGISLGIDPVDAIRNSVDHGVLGDARRRRRSGPRQASRSPSSGPARPAARHRLDAADRHVGGDDRLRHADHVRHRPGRLARLVVARADRPGARRACRSSSATASASCVRSTPRSATRR